MPVDALESKELLWELRSRRDRVAAILASEARALEPFTDVSDDSRRVIRHRRRDYATRTGDQDKSRKAGDLANEATSTAFALANLLAPRAENQSGTPGEELLPEGELLIKTALGDYERMYSPNRRDQDANKDAERLPNTYSSSIHLWALAKVIQNRPGAATPEITRVGLFIAEQLSSWLEDWHGQVHDLVPVEAPRQGTPDPYTQPSGNPYLTHITVRALSEYVDSLARLEEGIPAVVTQALRLSLAAAQAEICRLVAAYHSGVQSLFDGVDLICPLATVGLLTKQLNLADDLSRALIHQALKIVTSDFLLPDGSFAPKSAVFHTRTGLSINVSSAELALLLIHGLATYIDASELIALDPILSSVHRRSSGHRGWGLLAKGNESKVLSFVTTASLGFLHVYHAIASRIISETAAKELGVRTLDVTKPAFPLPSSVRSDIERQVILPLKSGDHRLASMSFVLGGPPGTAKTTIAATIARELEWPLLTLDLGSFLRRGLTQLEAEAERIFNLLLDLKNVVVLFDEIEEVVLRRDALDSERESRFLTSAMLPRLHRLRDARNVVFAIATNYPDKLDTAATRPGRIDFIFEVKPPEADEREKILAAFAKEFSASQEVKSFLLSRECIIATDQFTVGYLQKITQRIILMKEIWTDHARMMSIINEEGKRVLKERSVGGNGHG